MTVKTFRQDSGNTILDHEQFVQIGFDEGSKNIKAIGNAYLEEMMSLTRLSAMIGILSADPGKIWIKQSEPFLVNYVGASPLSRMFASSIPL
ncbi:MAG: hypothetical protein RMI78_00170 [Nitrososphaerota archaeon]|nr:hypothetical protein [Nitrososphaerota archaeon]